MKELLAELGVTDVEAAKALVSSAKEAEDAQKTEAQKLAEENARLKAEAVQATQLATQAVAGTALREGLRDAGINPERISAAIRLVDLATVQVNGADVTGVTEAVESVKASSPEWFGPQAGAPDATGGTGGGTGTDYRTSSRDELRDAAAKYGIAL